MSDTHPILSPARAPGEAGSESFKRAFSAAKLWNGRGLAMLALAVCWLLFFKELLDEWQINPQYNYGYFVPFLGLALFWCRWPERPLPATPQHTFLLATAAAGLLLLMLPLRVVLQANPEWRLLYWIHGFQVVGLSFCLLYFIGGSPWVRFFSIPIAFMLIAVPWPMELEQMIIQSLMRLVAALTVGMCDWLGIPAVQHGNLVEVGAGVVGIDEACSGVRSFQSALMLSLFLGELRRFSVFKRLALLGGSLLLVLVANLARTTILVWAAASRGLLQMEAWHDLAGNLVMFIVLPGLILLAHLMKAGVRKHPPQWAPVPVALPTISRWIGLGTLAWLVVTEASSEAWYRTHELHLVSNVRWSVAWPNQSSQFKPSAVPQKSLAILRCSDSDAASWQDEDGNRWSGFFLHWAPGKNSAQLAKGHRPDICFPAAGARLVSDLGQVTLPAAGIELHFQHQVFENDAGPFHVFYCLWSDRMPSKKESLLEDGSQGSRLRAVLAGRRNLGQRVLELVIQGPQSSDEALALLRAEGPGLIRREPLGG
jgi:exosortase